MSEDLVFWGAWLTGFVSGVGVGGMLAVIYLNWEADRE